jgi:MFS family permease
VPRGLVLRLLGFCAARELIPLYGIYALLFRDSGLSDGAVSSLFVIWSITGFVFEVPSGAWADTYDRRRLLVWAALISACGFALWTAWPTYAGFAAGFVMWGLSGAMVSGTFESLVYDELAARQATIAYPRLLGWARAAETAAATLGILLGAPLYAIGGYALAGWVGVAFAAGAAVLAATLPDRRSGPTGADSAVRATLDDDELSAGSAGYLASLRAGVAEATRHPIARRAVMITALLYGLTTYDEYLPLVARESGTATATVPLLVGAVTVGELVGVAFAGRTAHLSRRHVGAIVAAGAVLLALGALSGHPAGFIAIAAAFGLIHNTVVISEARLQDAITGPARATVTSVAGLATEVVVLGVYAGVAIGSVWLSVSVLVALCAVPTVAAAAATARWLPSRRPASLTADVVAEESTTT